MLPILAVINFGNVTNSSNVVMRRPLLGNGAGYYDREMALVLSNSEKLIVVHLNLVL